MKPKPSSSTDRRVAIQSSSVYALPGEALSRIGTGRNATAEQAEEAHAHIRGRLQEWFGAAVADRCRILYGGSVKPGNIRELIAQPDVDGALVGGASLEVESFAAIVTACRPAAV